MSDRFDPRERWRWEEERERQDQGLETEGRFIRHGGDSRWGTGGLGDERRTRSSRETPPPPRPDLHAPYRTPYVVRPPLPHEVRLPYEPRGPYVGYGPRGYHRSDERIHEDVCERLTEHGDVDARDIEVTVAGAEVTLSGTVPSRGQKRLAEDVADAVSGVIEVHNRLRIQRSAEPPPISRSVLPVTPSEVEFQDGPFPPERSTHR